METHKAYVNTLQSITSPSRAISQKAARLSFASAVVFLVLLALLHS